VYHPRTKGIPCSTKGSVSANARSGWRRNGTEVKWQNPPSLGQDLTKRGLPLVLRAGFLKEVMTGKLAIETVKTQTSESINYLDLINGVY